MELNININIEFSVTKENIHVNNKYLRDQQTHNTIDGALKVQVKLGVSHDVGLLLQVLDVQERKHGSSCTSQSIKKMKDNKNKVYKNLTPKLFTFGTSERIVLLILKNQTK